MLPCNVLIPQFPSLYIANLDFKDKTCTNKTIRGVLMHVRSELFPFQLKRKNILKEYYNESVVRIKTKYLTLPIPPKAKKTHFRIMNDIYPSNDLVRQRFNIYKNNCVFCD